MAAVTSLRLTSSSFAPINLNSYTRRDVLTLKTLGYTPMSPDITIAEVESYTQEGQDILSTSRRNVGETATVRMTGPYADIRAELNNIELALRQAEEAQTGVAAPVYVEYAPPGSSAKLTRVLSSSTGTTTIYVDAPILKLGEYVYLQNYGSNKSERALVTSNVTVVTQELEYSYVIDRQESAGTWALATNVFLGLNRSEILTGRVEIVDGALEQPWKAGFIEINITWTRKFYWETVDIYQLATTNRQTPSFVVGSATSITNTTATGPKDNWVQVSGSTVQGSIPSPIQLELYNSYDNTNRLGRFYVGQNVFAASTFTSLFEGESADNRTGNVSNAAYSSGLGGYKSWTGTGWVPAFSWLLSSSIFANARGSYFKILAAFIGKPLVGTEIQVIIHDASTTVVVFDEGPVVRVSAARHELVDLGVFKFPPYKVNRASLSSLYPLRMTIMVRYRPNTGTQQISLDRLYALPVQGIREVDYSGFNAAYGVTTVIDENERTGWTYGWTDFGDPTNNLGSVLLKGRPLMIWPRKDQQFHFAMENFVDSSEAQRTAQVKLFYRPRRLTI